MLSVFNVSNRLFISITVLIVSISSILLANCGNSTPVTQPTAVGQPKSEPVETYSPGSLVIYSGRSDTLVAPIIDQFQEATGIKVDVKWGKTFEIAALLMEEGDATPADIFLAQDTGGLAAVVDQLSPLPNDILARVPRWAKSPHNRWVGISGRARVVIYNSKNVESSDLPSTIEGFVDPKWKGRIGWPPSNGSFQAMVTAMRSVWGDERTRQWLVGIKNNMPQEYPKNTPTVAAAGSGEIDVGFVNHYYLYRFIEQDGESFGARNHHLDGGGPGSIILVSGAGILGNSSNRDNAEKFLRFLLSTPAQQYFASSTYEYPLTGNVKAHRLLKPLEKINNPNIDMASLDDLKGTQLMLRDLGIIP